MILRSFFLRYIPRPDLGFLASLNHFYAVLSRTSFHTGFAVHQRISVVWLESTANIPTRADELVQWNE